MSERPTAPEDIMAALAEPFDAAEVKFKPAIVKDQRALAIAYVDARVIMDRLDDVLGVTGWQDDFEFLPDGSCMCRLRLRIGGEWITKVDVGGESEQPDEHDRHKAAVSDALKRAAVKFGMGRYLYRLPSQWCDYDQHKRQFTRTPTLPASALPGKKLVQAPAVIKKVVLPKDGKELLVRLQAFDRKLSAEGACQPGQLVEEVRVEGVSRGFSSDIKDWGLAGIQFAVDFVKEYQARAAQEVGAS